MVIRTFKKGNAQSLEIRKIIFINAVIIASDRNHTVCIAVVLAGKIENSRSLLVIIHGPQKVQFSLFQHIHQLNQLLVHGAFRFHELIGPTGVLGNLLQIIVGVAGIIAVVILHG